ncbi:hypothetical protein P168DRAFT_322485 [Aspergillus campestris IBT 28561]|uniref:Uncharacterized protein n=1 Tax=Aspergillus campestris (strain IBT 28561) TaxID=1392248 RepID=A0A2I1CQX8_ASPC2|nr:uncharacterized protein P168DRAFT_322485 [Aspergillus campestris IBT 28561]PKY00023.1 hypothetical protein P168DRAFT_322485 [Aspergillus campestris IBT 28561]
MASYHRVLETFGRSVQDNTLECDCDIHPWEISINGEQWAGKIRLIGFIDVFFLISYSANARFEHGIIVYKENGVFEAVAGYKTDRLFSGREESKPTHVLPQVDQNTEDSEISETEEGPDSARHRLPKTPASHGENSSRINQQKGRPNDGQEDSGGVIEFYRSSTFTTKGLGHQIGLRATYRMSSVREYTVEIVKQCNGALNKRIRRGIKPHSTAELMKDVVRCGIITQGQLAGHIIEVLLAGSRLDDTAKKYLEELKSGNDAGRHFLSNERT